MDDKESLHGFELALVGAGRMGQTHLRALAGSAAVTVRDVVEPLPALRDQLARSGYQVHASVEDLLESARPHAVLVAAPTGQHATIVRTVASAGLPVLCEKPAGLTSAAVRELGQFAAAAGVAFQVAYWRRYVPQLQRIRERIASGAFGDVHLVVGSQWDGSPPSAAFRATSGGIFIDMGVHEFDEICWLTGQQVIGVEAIAAACVSDSAVVSDVDSAEALVVLSGGSTGIVSIGRHYPGGDMAAVEVFGTRDHERVVFLSPELGDAPLLAALQHQAKDFARFVRTGVRHGCGVDDAAMALAAAERASRSVDLPMSISSIPAHGVSAGGARGSER